MFKTGLGYDIHKLVRSRPFILGNITIPYKKGFLAHSDGDVLIHSMIDAIFGAMNVGDIGTHFSDKDAKYKNIDSKILLQKTMQLVREQNYSIGNIDSTVICQRPKLQPFILDIRKKLSDIMQVNIERISVKSKTKEKIGSVGRRKAVEVLTIVLLEKK